jgi:hypothetical protein
MSDKSFFIGSIVGLFAGITIGKFMFDSDSKLPTKNKWSCKEKIIELEKENKILNNEIDFLIKEKLKSK